MDTARAQLVEALRKLDHRDRLRIYHPVTDAGAEIYVHAKVTIVDDTYLRVGSSNFNNRSMRLDTECYVMLAAERPGAEATRATITALRDDLLAEHLAMTPDQVTQGIKEHGSLIAMIDANRGTQGQGRTLIPYEIPELSGFEAWLAENEILDPEGPRQDL